MDSTYEENIGDAPPLRNPYDAFTELYEVNTPGSNQPQPKLNPIRLSKTTFAILFVFNFCRDSKWIVDQWRGRGETMFDSYKNTTSPTGLKFANRFMIFAFAIWMHCFLINSLHLLQYFGYMWKKMVGSDWTPGLFSISRAGSFTMILAVLISKKGSDVWKYFSETWQLERTNSSIELQSTLAEILEAFLTSMTQFPLIGLTILLLLFHVLGFCTPNKPESACKYCGRITRYSNAQNCLAQESETDPETEGPTLNAAESVLQPTTFGNEAHD